MQTLLRPRPFYCTLYNGRVERKRRRRKRRRCPPYKKGEQRMGWVGRERRLCCGGCFQVEGDESLSHEKSGMTMAGKEEEEARLFCLPPAARLFQPTADLVSWIVYASRYSITET